MHITRAQASPLHQRLCLQLLRRRPPPRPHPHHPHHPLLRLSLRLHPPPLLPLPHHHPPPLHPQLHLLCAILDARQKTWRCPVRAKPNHHRRRPRRPPPPRRRRRPPHRRVAKAC